MTVTYNASAVIAATQKVGNTLTILSDYIYAFFDEDELDECLGDLIEIALAAQSVRDAVLCDVGVMVRRRP